VVYVVIILLLKITGYNRLRRELIDYENSCVCVFMASACGMNSSGLYDISMSVRNEFKMQSTMERVESRSMTPYNYPANDLLTPALCMHDI